MSCLPLLATPWILTRATIGLVLAVLAFVAPVGAASGLPAGSDGGRGQNAPAPATGAFDAAELEGADEKVAELAAHKLFLAISSTDREREKERLQLLGYVLERLGAVRLAQPRSSREALVAERLVSALATWISSSGPPFPNAAEILVPLLGLGSATQRDAAMRAVRALVMRELREPRRSEPGAAPPAAGESRSPTLQLIVRGLQESQPRDAFLRDASQVLWETDGKLLLATLVGVLKTQSGAIQGSPGYTTASTCLAELRLFLSVDFPSLEAWLKWWGETSDQPLDRILADCQRRQREAFVANWRQVLRRLRETGDTERLLLAIQETLDTVPVLELRVAATVALGDYAEWLADARVEAKPAAEPASEGGQRDKLLFRAAQLLMAPFERETFPPEAPEVLRAAIGALRKHHSFLERTPALQTRVSRIVVSRLEALLAPGPGRAAGDLHETIRLAGALRVSEAAIFLLALLTEERPPPEDLELLTAAVAALGRLHEKGLSKEVATILMTQFRAARPGSDKGLRELKRACVTALTPGSEDLHVRDSLRRFYLELLAGMERDVRIPAVLGLGTLARQKDAEALQALMDMLESHEQFEPQEIVAAIDSIAYVGGQSSLVAFLEALGKVRDNAVAESLWKKLLGALTGPGSVSLAWVFETLERLALEADAPVYLEHLVKLAAEPQVAATAGLDPAELPPVAQLDNVWRTAACLARARDLLGDEAGAAQAVARLGELLQKSPDLATKFPAAAKAHADLRGGLAQRAALQARIPRAEGAEAQQLVRDIDAYIDGAADLTGRWRSLRWLDRQLNAEGGPESRARLRELCLKSLSAAGRTMLWQGFPAGFRERYLARWGDPAPGRPKASVPESRG